MRFFPKTFLSASTLLVLSFGAADAAAQAGPRALVFCGDNGYCDNTRTTLATSLVAAGAQGVDESTTLSNLTNYRMIFVEAPRNGLTPANQTTLASFHASGGVIVAVADSYGFNPTVLTTLNDLATAAGVTTKFTNNSYDSGCSHVGTPQAHPLTANWATPSYAWSSNTTMTGTLILSGETGQGLVRLEGHWVAVADTQIIDDLCGTNPNGAFFSNLWTFFKDSDSDGVSDGYDNCPMNANAGQEDGDGDGMGDVCDPCPVDPDNDIDADGVCGDVDNCIDTANPGQEDTDGDTVGDVCDVCPNDAADDADADGFCADEDNCPDITNPAQSDGDGDGIGDICDTCSFDPSNDADGDGVCGETDNCAMTPNANQKDSDGDGVGDACDDTPNGTGGMGGGSEGGAASGGAPSTGGESPGVGGSGGAGGGETGTDDGCGCSVAGDPERVAPWALLLGVAALSARRRRR